MEDLCKCGSNSFFVEDDLFYCSYCKKPTGTKFSDLKPATKEDITKFNKKLQESSTSSNSSYAPYTLVEVDNFIKIFHEKYSIDKNYQTNLNYKLLYIIRDLLIRIEKLERRIEMKKEK